MPTLRKGAKEKGGGFSPSLFPRSVLGRINPPSPPRNCLFSLNSHPGHHKQAKKRTTITVSTIFSSLLLSLFVLVKSRF